MSASDQPVVTALPNIKVGSRVLVTTNEWFYAPDGRTYKAVFGTVRGVFTSESTLGVRTNGKSTNWYLDVGCVTIAGCQIHYLVSCDSANFGPVSDWGTHEGKATEYTRPSCVFNGDGQ
jgi:hypothetical protein